jgi:hypothetical protein
LNPKSRFSGHRVESRGLLAEPPAKPDAGAGILETGCGEEKDASGGAMAANRSEALVERPSRAALILAGQPARRTGAHIVEGVPLGKGARERWVLESDRCDTVMGKKTFRMRMLSFDRCFAWLKARAHSMSMAPR